MPLKDQIKNFTRKLVENKPDVDALADMVHHGKVTSMLFENDGIVLSSEVAAHCPPRIRAISQRL